ncbi:hypothetical protein MsAg5_11280 [Methanosarcinaceae archaeon Ag5]|uniref:Peptidase M10 metallopeptidase domain-containing protein n=1 Tax=Methanolapillus africanus TaxID=3028297 RepID=A0AAE4SDY7_9EURY|nr:hypothetical protein [Methanosarcinaceae archaeon Ag5]
MRLKITSILCALIIFSMISSATACNFHITEAVDSKKGMQYGGTLAYYVGDLNTSIAIWNALGKVKIEKDTILTLQDLDIHILNRYDPYQPATPGVYNSQNKSITYYVPVISNFTQAQRVKTMTHELGHALGIDEIHVDNNIMQPSPANNPSSLNTLGTQDRAVYTCRWG